MASQMKKKTIKNQRSKKEPLKEPHITVCTNKDCKLRKAGCKGFEACPGYKGK